MIVHNNHTSKSTLQRTFLRVYPDLFTSREMVGRLVLVPNVSVRYVRSSASVESGRSCSTASMYYAPVIIFARLVLVILTDTSTLLSILGAPTKLGELLYGWPVSFSALNHL
jgi:hypothetical protein